MGKKQPLSVEEKGYHAVIQFLLKYPQQSISNPNFLRLFPINFLDFTHQNLADKPIKYCFVQFFNG